MTFDFDKTVNCGTANQYLFYANSNGTNYQKYYPSISVSSAQGCTQSIPPSNPWDQKFPNVSEFQIGYASVNPGTKQPIQALSNQVNNSLKFSITQ